MLVEGTLIPEPRTREDIKVWREQRRAYFERLGIPEPPLSAREYLMIQRLGTSKPKYSLT